MAKQKEAIPQPVEYDDEEPEYEVEKIYKAERRKKFHHRWFYFVKWKGFDDEEDNSWVDTDDMGTGELVPQFWRDHGYDDAPTELSIKVVPAPNGRLKTKTTAPSKTKLAKSIASSSDVSKSSSHKKKSAPSPAPKKTPPIDGDDEDDEMARKSANSTSENDDDGDTHMSNTDRKSKTPGSEKTESELYRREYPLMPKETMDLDSWEDVIDSIITVALDYPQRYVLFKLRGSNETYCEPEELFFKKAVYKVCDPVHPDSVRRLNPPRQLARFYSEHLEWKQEAK